MTLEIRSGENGLLRLSVSGHTAKLYHDVFESDTRFRKVRHPNKESTVFKLSKDATFDIGGFKLYLWPQDYIKVID